MTVLFEKSFTPSSAEETLTACFESYRGGVLILGAGEGGTIKLYVKINGVSVLVDTQEVGCPVEIRRVVGSGVTFCVVAEDVVGCLQLQVVDVSAVINGLETFQTPVE
jgi:hypothetical protein